MYGEGGGKGVVECLRREGRGGCMYLEGGREGGCSFTVFMGGGSCRVCVVSQQKCLVDLDQHNFSFGTVFLLLNLDIFFCRYRWEPDRYENIESVNLPFSKVSQLIPFRQKTIKSGAGADF